MAGKIVNLNKARKAKARVEKDVTATENRVKFGRKKSEKEKEAKLAERRKTHLDGHKRDDKS